MTRRDDRKSPGSGGRGRKDPRTEGRGKRVGVDASRRRKAVSREPAVEGASSRSVTVLLVDDHKLFADAVHPVLESAGMTVLQPEINAGEVMDRVREDRPDLILVDLGLPGHDGIEVGRQILEEHPHVTVVALTALNHPRAVTEALRAGFHGYLTKDIPLPQFVQAIQAAMQGQVVIPRRLARGAAGALSEEERYVELLSQQLTPREYEVLALLVEGLNTKDIAKRLGVSPHTVRTHVQNILEKLQLRSRLEAAAFAVRHGLVARPDN